MSLRLALLGVAVAAVAFLLLAAMRTPPGAFATCSTSPFTPLVVTDLPDYFPGDTVTIDGCGFENYVDQTLPVVITYPDGTLYTKTAVVDSSGNFTVYWVLNDATFGKYLVQVFDPTQTTVVASTTFLDHTVNLDQCANGSPKYVDLHCNWRNGDLNGSNSQYAEGDSIPYRLFITNITPGSHTIHINYDFTQGGVKAFDFLTTWNVTQTGADPCSGSASVPTPCPAGPVSSFAFPGDLFNPSNKGVLTVDGAIADAGVSRNLTIYNGTITSISAVTHSGPVTGDSNADMTVTFTANACSGTGCKSKVELLWAGHVAKGSFWGAGNGATSISGAPFHMRTQNLDGDGSRNQDRSVQLSALMTATATPTPTAAKSTKTPTVTSTATKTQTPTPTKTSTNTATATAAATSTATNTATATSTATNTATATKTATNTATATSTATNTATATSTATNTATATRTATNTATATSTATNTATATSPATNTPTVTSSATNTATATSTPTSTITSTPITGQETSTPTVTSTATNTAVTGTATTTATPGSNPGMCKVVLAAVPNTDVCNSTVGGVAANLANLFLTRQGTKIPPNTCLQGTNKVTLAEMISIPVGGGPNPKTPTLVRTAELGGFSFQVKYDPLKVCIVLHPGPAWSVSPSQICTIQDSVTAPTIQGIATIHCVTLGKTTTVDTGSADPTKRLLALIDVRPQPNVFNQIKPNQENGQIVQITDEGCKLTDVQGLAFTVFSCKSAEVTVRFLEGDVEPDCQINTLDTQSIAFRFGSIKGSLVFNDRFNMMPNPPATDQIIDINDVQFVFGRFGSTCTNPWPPQAPVNGKQ